MLKNKTKVALIFLFILLLIKTDYRLESTINCCGDDFDYYIHAYTLAIDYDFNYENQIPDYSKFYYSNGNKIAPVGFSGSGILAAPFLLLGNFLDNLFDYSNKVFNFKILLYSTSSLFYLTMSSILLQKTMLVFNKNISRIFILFLLSGSGVAYFALERFSMTHVYEVFANSLILFLSSKAYKTNKKTYIASIPFAIFLSLLIKLSNYYILLIPLIVKEMLAINFPEIIFKLKNKIALLSGTLASLMFFVLINFNIYGKIIINPGETYAAQGQVSNYLESTFNIFNFLFEITKTLFIVSFSQEFGIFWFSPVIFALILLNFYYFIQKKYLLFFILSISIFSNIAIINLWQSTGSSYGFRYLFSLIPIGLFIIINSEIQLSARFLKFYIVPFSIFGILAIFIFESTPFVQLTTYDALNSFGKTIRYVQPEYLSGVFKSLIVFDGYLKLFATSFLGLVFFKLLLSMLSVEGFYGLLSSLGLPLDNEDFITLINKIENISFFQILLFLLVIALCLKLLLKRERI